MNRTTIFIGILFLSSCAQMVQKAKNSLNKEKYEKELPYKEGQIVTVKGKIMDYFSEPQIWGNGEMTRKGKLKSNPVNHLGKVTRYGLKGSHNQKILNLKAPKDWLIIPNTRKIKHVSFKAKVLKVDRECDPYVSSSTISPDTCKSGSSFIDELSFIEWSLETKNAFTTLSAKWGKRKKSLDKERALEEQRNKKFSNAMNPTIQRKKYPKQAKSCDQKLKELKTFSKQVGAPAITKGEIKKIIKENKGLIDKANACANSFLYTEKQTEQYALAIKCVQYSSTSYKNQFCN